MEKQLEAQVATALQVARIPEPSHRYAAASAPWPWFDDGHHLSSVNETLPSVCDHQKCQNSCWSRYPQNIFPTWTPLQVERSGIKKAIMKISSDDAPSVILRLDVIASPQPKFTIMKPIIVGKERHEWLAATMIRTYTSEDKAPNSLVRILFLETVTGSVLQILGTCYNIAPSFFSSALNWTPAKYLDCVSPHEGDHLTVVLPFLHPISEDNFVRSTSPLEKYPPTSNHTRHHSHQNLPRDLHLIDTQAPLRLSSNQTILAQDLLAVHVIRREVASTIITYHPKFGLPTTTAQVLRDKIHFAGHSTYWQGIMEKKCDPTLILLMFMWHAVYGWDAAFEKLYSHICFLETRVMMASEMTITQELHILRAHNLHYASLLRDLRKTVEFISTHAHSLPDSIYRPEKYDADKTIPIQAAVRLECVNLLESVERLEMAQKMHDDRLNNVMNLVFNYCADD